mgnify:CR=1 FL=1
MSDTTVESFSTEAMKTPSDSQRLAINEIKTRIISTKLKGQVLLGGTGSGKTITSIVTINEIVAELAEGPKLCFCIVPSMGETVFQQWKDELTGQGCGDRVLIYHGPKRTQQLAEFRARMSKCTDDVAWYVITSIETTNADVNARLLKDAGMAAKKCSPQEVAAARRAAIRDIGKVDVVVVDECHTFGNGSPPTDSSREIDTTKTLYLTLNELITANAPRFTLALTATPTKNTSGEVYSILRFILGPGFRKEAFVHATRDYGVQTKVVKSYVVQIPATKLPPTTHGTISHNLTVREAAIHANVYSQLYSATEAFLRAISAWAAQKGNPHLAGEKERCKRAFLMFLTRARRMALHPALAEPAERADPAVHPLRDSAGEIVYTTDSDGKRVPLGKPLPIDVAATVAAWPIDHCSKFRAILDKLAKTTNERTVVQMSYSEPCDLFEAYFRQRFQDREVYVYHGGRARRAAVMEAFKHGAPDAVLVATRGSCSVALNIETTTTGSEWDAAKQQHVPRRLAVRQIFADLPLSQADQDQAEGRTKRPQAQGHPADADRVLNWFVDTARADLFGKPTIEDFLEKTIKIKAVRCADFLHDAENAADHVGDAPTLTGSEEKKNDSVLGALLDTLAPYKVQKQAKKRKTPPSAAAPSAAAVRPRQFVRRL